MPKESEGKKEVELYASDQQKIQFLIQTEESLLERRKQLEELKNEHSNIVTMELLDYESALKGALECIEEIRPTEENPRVDDEEFSDFLHSLEWLNRLKFLIDEHIEKLAARRERAAAGEKIDNLPEPASQKSFFINPDGPQSLH